MEPRVPIDRWNQVADLMQGSPLTNNSTESYNSKWTQSSLPKAGVWKTIVHIREEDTLALSQWREAISTARPEPASTGDHNSRRIKQKQKVIQSMKKEDKCELKIGGEIGGNNERNFIFI